MNMFVLQTEKILDADDIVGHLQKLTFIIYVVSISSVIISLTAMYMLLVSYVSI